MQVKRFLFFADEDIRPVGSTSVTPTGSLPGCLSKPTHGGEIMTTVGSIQENGTKNPACSVSLEISVERLRATLEQGADVTVLDVRPTDERAEWSIPGSLHIDAYHALRSGDASALDGIDLPRDVPVVTVCARGRTSQIAARLLRDRGVEAYSLEGGMKAWSVAWNVAELLCRDATLLQLRRTGKGCLSYMLASQREAVVVDASLSPEVYLGIAEARGWTIRHVVDTHIHADHLARSRVLAGQAGAKQWLPEQDRAHYPFSVLRGGDELRFGSTSLRALHTPGHTMESTTFLVAGRWLLTGDTLFPNAVGRPDLEASVDEATQRALLLYGSLRQLLDMDPELLVLAGHTSSPIAFDQVPICSTLQAAREAVQLPADAATFADRILRKLPPTPPNHSRIVASNEAGELPVGDLTDLEAGANRCAIS